MPPLDWGSSAIRIYAAYWTLPTAYLGRFYFFFLRFTPSTFFNILREKIEIIFVYFINYFSDCKKKKDVHWEKRSANRNSCILIPTIAWQFMFSWEKKSHVSFIHFLFHYTFTSFFLYSSLLFFYYITYHIHYFFSLFFFFLCFSYLHPYLCRYIIVL